MKAYIYDRYSNLTNWNNAVPVCSWIGVTCSARYQRVTALNLSDMGLSGGLPMDAFNYFQELRELYLSGNQFYGEIPSSLFKCRQLQVLSLSDNQFTGTIPREIGNLTMLKKLYLSYNHLKGSIPSSIGNCTLLKVINFSENNLTGAMPPEIGGLSNLEIFRIRSNVLSGNIPSALFNISTIKVIALDGNRLSGSFPSITGLFLPNLTKLFLGGNEFSGIIPTYISNASKLAFLDLSSNSFSGFIPNVLGDLRHLKVLNLANNDLTTEPSTPDSSFLSALTKWKHLRKIALSGNLLNATFRSSLVNLSTSLQWFSADNCKIKGSIPGEIGNLTSLIALNLGNNELTGAIPTTVGRLIKLQGLDLQSNKLRGTIPYDLCNLNSLVDLSLGGNEISGSIPECLGSLTTLRHLNISSNNLTSTIPLALWRLTDILTINMSSNFLSGSFQLQNQLKAVVEIDLSRNQLSGEIAEFIPVTLSLELLDLSHNNLSGVIPNASGFLNLKYFNVSFNGLEGEIPNEGPFINFPAQSYMNNKALCGPPRFQVPPCKAGDLPRPKKKIKVPLKLLWLLIAFAIPIIVIVGWLKRKKSSGTPFIAPIKRYSYLELQHATDGFCEGNVLGRGSFGTVYKGALSDGMVVAIKVFDMEEERSLRSFDVECEVMHNVRHRNLIRILSSCRHINLRALVMEYMCNGSLEKWLHTHNYHLDILQRLDIMVDTASAVRYLHYDCAKSIIHCDLKPGNILLDDDMIACVSDFSIAKFIDLHSTEAPRHSGVMCTFGYAAPELGLYGTVSTKTDVYSFGILLMETFTGKRPTDERFSGEMSLKRWVIESLAHEVYRVVDPSLLRTKEEHVDAKLECLSGILRLALCCTSEAPSARLNMKEVVYGLNRIKGVYLRNISQYK